MLKLGPHTECVSLYSVLIMPMGHYEYLLMPFVLMNTPEVCQQLINAVLQETLNQYAFIYLDYILIFSNSQEEHMVDMQRVLQLILQNHLHVKLEKLLFHVTMIFFLGFLMPQGSLHMD